MLSAQAQSLSDGNNLQLTGTDPELMYHTAPPGMIISPRIDVSQMMMVYDLTFISRDVQVYFRWGKLDENGEGIGFWTRWRDYDGTFTFSERNRYVLEAHAEAIGKERSTTLKATYMVDYIGTTSAPGIALMPCGERGYEVSFSSPYDYDIYYRWRHYDDEVWEKWRLYSETLPFTEAGTYVIEARCDNGVVSAYVEVPSIEYVQTGDVDHNGEVNISDITALINMLQYNTGIPTGDVNKDGNVDISDVTALINMLINN